VAGRRGLVDGSGVGLLGRWIVDCLFVCFLFFFGGGGKVGVGWWVGRGNDIEREKDWKGHDGKITKCCSSTHIPSKSRSGSRW